MPRLLRSVALGIVLAVVVTPAFGQVSEYGQTEFQNSGADAAQEPFLRGLLMLHSFEYDDARSAFQEAQTVDPDFAMAHWGEAMTHNHPVWMEQDRGAALEALQDLAPTPEERLEMAPTEREKAYLRTVHVLYGAGETNPKSKEARDDAYAEAMASLAEQYPEDLNARSLYALSILGTAHEGRDFATYMRAAAVVEEVFDENPKHPGAAHYLIHTYDDPVHAPLGLRPARVYADIAPAAPHALHMPSHIFFALGLWDKGAASNVDSYDAARAKSEERGEGLSGGGFHALHWLHYARLQQGRYDDAQSVLATTQRHATDSTASRGYATYMRWYMPIAYVVETQRWERLAPLLDSMNVDPSTLDKRGAVSVYVAQGLAAANQNDTSGAVSALEHAESAVGDSASTDLKIQIQELKGVIALNMGNAEEGLTHLERAATLEAEKPLDFGPPFPPKPAQELYGEALLSLDRPADALTQFEATLDRYPDRALALLGAARAATRSDRLDRARTVEAELSAQWTDADAPVRTRLEALSESSASAAAGAQ